jgi:molybdopterin molybdotransferase
LKDGFAVKADDIAAASPDSPVTLKLSGYVAAGGDAGAALSNGEAARVLSGAPIPPGADAVLSEEFSRAEDGYVQAFADAGPGRNIMPRGSDVANGERLAGRGRVLTPGVLSLLTAGGLSVVSVFRMPRVGLIATGSEVLLPGRTLERGKLYASNVVLQDAWLKAMGCRPSISAAGDSHEEIAAAAKSSLLNSDAIITSGGAWKGDRDLVVSVFEKMGCSILFHRVRMGPGKAVGVGLLDGKAVFFLPGGPTSNEMAFLMIAFPAVLKMAGHAFLPYICQYGILEKEVRGQRDWTQFLQCMVSRHNRETRLHPVKLKSRLASMASAQALIKIPEGVESIPAGSTIPFICMDQSLFKHSLSVSDAG